MALLNFTRLQKQLSLFDVYVISTGAMISSGFFLLPGIAVTHAGPGVVLAYLLSGVLILPAMLSQAELATAMPRAGGAYYFLDRTLGPLVGAIGGVGTWIALVLKSAFALIGMGAYLALVVDVPIVPTAVAFTVVFAALNIAGAKESSGLLRVLVVTLLSILAFFIIHGLTEVGAGAVDVPIRRRFTPLLPYGIDGLLGTVGLVFVSYVGLTQVASLAEEVKNPDRNIPLGMGLALATVTAVYVLGVYIMVAVLGTDTLGGSLTPVADAANAFWSWLPRRAGVLLIVVAAIVAFASMSNAGILAASRYPLAMARDRLFPDRLATTGRWGTPVAAIALTCTLLVVFLVVLDVESVAKLASSLQLLLFAFINVAVIVMRESRIEAYDPGFRSPLYPWVQLVGLFVPIVLVAEMGWLPVLFTVGITALCFGWYTYYAQPRIARDGAIYHVFERLGRRRFAGLDRELRDLMKEKGLRAEDPFDEVVARASVIDIAESASLETIIGDASALLHRRLPVTTQELFDRFGRGVGMGGTPVAFGAALIHTRLPEIEISELVLVRCRGGVRIDVDDEDLVRQAADVPIRAVFCLVSGESDPGRHLRILAQLAGRVEDEDFMSEWLRSRDEQELKETLLRDDRFLSLKLKSGTKAEALIGHSLNELNLPPGSLVALIRRYGETIVPRGRTVLREGDRLTVIGEPEGLRKLAEQYGR
ncbi:MAG: amino acid permease [Gemmatimonadales bacterium]|nr:amino acid permease [Gemmatimonadales bacterium]NIN12534.1 amino acid permease [Gemmatimonadales bacterium]NIN50905.1 amino acid permease [Gemmatimonadales bacterium]NIP08369.1 amino acid permease [Gemmatimonadales bacterium]NIR03466.1 amino acid permease [Gemmatimonadales bacterium]